MSFLSDFEDKFLRLQFGGKDRVRIYRKIIRFLDNGVPLPAALDTMWRHASQDGKKPKAIGALVIDAWRRQIANGKPLGVAIQGWVPEADRVVIEAGEQAGNLSGAIDNACILYESQKRIRAAVIGGLAYPIVLVMTAIGFLIVFGTQVIPAFSTVLPRDRWTGVGWQMGVMSDFVNTGLAPLLGALAFLVALMIWSMPRWTGKTRVKFDRIPPYSIYRLIRGAGFLLSLAAMVKAGLKVTMALRSLARDATPWYGERIGRTLAFVNEGLDIGDALYRTELEFPDAETVADLRAYAKLDGFDEMLIKIGRENLDDTVARLEQQSAVMRNAGIVLLGIVFIWIATGIFSLQQQISAAV